ncbi:hypothetical protein H2509_07065 [Stappia sp. F7233]|uniref:Uncharacterized protein n=1 Tax=Stappia albiluteola TaxID=2758565 RepID=A0A839ACZ4_9HYPH|nr:hypothetical protein [Stappia albiluteola]MBA5776888.1 hypothetical protein [Stappia albiluteola]
MDARAQLRRMMSDVDVAASRAERSLARARARTVALSDVEPKGAWALRSSLILAGLLMTARLLFPQG